MIKYDFAALNQAIMLWALTARYEQDLDNYYALRESMK